MEHANTDEAEDCLDDIRHVSDALAAYVKAVEPIIQQLADARAAALAEEEEE